MAQETMKAIVITAPGPVENLVIQDVPKPTATPGTALIKIRAFGLNHAEMHMRRGEWPEAMPISGIECVGTIEDCPGGEFAPGTAVAGIMGGLGRTINGTYAHYTVAKTSNIVTLAAPGEEPPISWERLAALPEVYCTTWMCLFATLSLTKGQRLLIRGATSALGRASVNQAVAAGALVTATARSEARFPLLKSLGVADVALEGPGLAARLREAGKPEKFDAVLDFIGNSAIVESMNLTRRGGRVCVAGWLGGLEPVKDFNPLLQVPSIVYLALLASPHFGMPDYPLSEVPLADIVRSVAEGKFDARPSKVFKFEEIRQAHQLMEEGKADGKMVVVVD